MNVQPIRDPAAGEQLLATTPEMTPTPRAPGWSRRLNLYTGRALGESALTLEQVGRAGRLAMSGRTLSHGIVRGLEVGVETEGAGKGARHFLHVAPGYALTVHGEDVHLPHTVRIAWEDLPIYLPAASAEGSAPPDAPAPPEGDRKETVPAPEVEARPVAEVLKGTALRLPGLARVETAAGAPTLAPALLAGVHPLVPGLPILRPLPAPEETPVPEGELPPRGAPRPVGGEPEPIGSIAAGRALPRVVVLLLEPVAAELVGESDPRDPCEADPDDDAYADWQLADGFRLALYAFPWEERVPLTPRESWRNRLAYEVFAAEAELGPGEHHPWEGKGVPLALLGLDEGHRPAWVDGFAVARDGGRPHRRTPLLSGTGDTFLWQARLKQFAEQVAEVDWSAADPRAEFARFAWIPPAGLLPRAAVDLERREVAAFPADYRVEAVPVPLEQLDAAIEASAPLRPFSARSADRVRVLVPVPQEQYEPRLLHRETADPTFEREIDRMLRRRAELATRRDELRRRAEVLARAAVGSVPPWPPRSQDPERLEDESGDDFLPLLAGRRARASAVAAGWHQHAYQLARPVALERGDTFYAWVYLDPLHRPATVMLQWRDGDGSWEHRAYWGEERTPPGDEGSEPARFMGALPPAGRWVRLAVPAYRVGMEERTVAAVAFALWDGRAVWDRYGRFSATDEVWVEDDVPAGAKVEGEKVHWVTSAPSPLSGKASRATDAAPGHHGHTIGPFRDPRLVERDDVLFAYVWLDPEAPPRQAMLSWYDGSWDHRAYWGESRIDAGVEGTASRRYMGPLPAAGEWARLEVPAAVVGLEGRAVERLGFELFGGRVAWDRSGRRRPTGSGLWGEYYAPGEVEAADRDFGELRHARLDPVPDFEPKNLPPDLPAEGFAARWAGYLVPPADGKYVLHLTAGDRVRLWLDAEKVVDAWATPPGGEVSVTRTLEGGRRHALRLEVAAGASPKRVTLRWTPPGGGKAVIPRAHLFPPAEADQDWGLEEGSAALQAAAVRDLPALEEVTWTADPALRPPEEGYGTEVAAGARHVPAVRQLVGRLLADRGGVKLFPANPPAPPAGSPPRLREADVKALERTGVRAFVERLSADVRRADDFVDMSFARLQSDLYRVRRLMLGRSASSRLATSPALASIVRSKSALRQREQLLSFLEKVRPVAAEGQAPAGTASSPTTAGPTASGPGSGYVMPNLFISYSPVTSLSKTQLSLISDAASGALATKASIGTTFPTAQTTQSAQISQAPAVQTVQTVQAAQLSALAPVQIRGFVRPVSQPVSTAATVSDVIFARPLLGEAYDFRNVTVGERMASPPANEAKSFAVLTRYEVLSGMLGLPVTLDNLFVPGFPKKKGTGFETRPYGRATVLVREARDVGVTGFRAEEVLEENDPADGDEGAFFSMAIELLDATVAGLRNLEGRIQLYREALQEAVAVLGGLQGNAAEVDRRLKVVGDELAEARHDVAVARALHEDEKERVRRINERRAAVLRDHVHFYAFQRPRLSSNLLDAPVRTLDPAFTASPVPDCLGSGDEAPAELRAIVEVLREAPLRFFRAGPALVRGIDTLPALQGTLRRARERAGLRPLAASLDDLQPRLAGPLGAAIGRTLAAQREVVALARRRTAQAELGALAAATWERAREEALVLASLGDLADAPHGNTAVDRAAARELDNLLRVSACLHRRLGAVRPALRLAWAEGLSQHDQATDLRNLFALPRFGEVEYLARREMQALVDWLFGRIAPGEPDAAAMMSDVVRICLLTASHAPVGQLLPGSVPRETEARVGGTVEVAAAGEGVRVGMHVLLYDAAKRPVHAVVEDLGAGVAVARVVQAAAASVTIPRDARAQLGGAARLAAAAALPRTAR